MYEYMYIFTERYTSLVRIKCYFKHLLQVYPHVFHADFHSLKMIIWFLVIKRRNTSLPFTFAKLCDFNIPVLFKVYRRL